MKNIQTMINPNSEDSNNTELLVSIIPITRGKLLNIRKEVRESFVKAALSKYDIGSTILVNDISSKIKDLTKCELSNEDIVSILHKLDEDGIVKHLEGFSYQINKKITLINFEQKTKVIWDEFEIYLKGKYPNYDPFLDKETKNIFISIILKLLEQFILSSDPIEKKIDILPLDNFESVADEYISKTQISEDLSKNLSKILHDYLNSNSPELSKFIFDHYYGIINMHLLRLEKKMNISNFLKDIKYLLVDTQFLVFLLCTSDSLHPLTSSIAKQCSKLKIPIYYTDKTKKEMWRFINGSKKEMKGFSRTRKHKPIRSQFIEDYINKDMLWTDYLSIIELWEVSVQKWGINPFPDEDKKEIQDKIDMALFSYVKKTLPIFDNSRYQSRLKRDSNYIHDFREHLQIKHDAYCMGFISNERKKLLKKEKRPLGPWFVTYDTLVSLVDAAYSKNIDLGLVIHPRSLFNYLLVYTKFDYNKEDEENVAQAIIKYTASTQATKLTLSQYSRIVTNKLGLEEEHIDIIKNVILSSPLKSELIRALRLNRGDLAEEITYQIFTDESFIQSIKDEQIYHEKLKKVSMELIKKKDELAKEKTKTEELEKMMNAEKQINISTIIKIDITTKNELNNLIQILDSNNAFDDGLIERPPKNPTFKKISEWLNKIKDTIETSTKIKEGIKTLLPFITYLIGKFGTT